jgi:hypothetical protein
MLEEVAKEKSSGAIVPDNVDLLSPEKTKSQLDAAEAEKKALKEHICQLEAKIKERDSKLESYSSVLKSPWIKLRLNDDKKYPLSGPSSDQKTSLKTKCEFRCQVLGMSINTDESSDELIVAHIWTKEFAAALIAEYGKRFGVNQQKNLLLLLKPVESKFDKGQICFLPRASADSVDGVLELTILDKSFSTRLSARQRKHSKTWKASCLI